MFSESCFGDLLPNGGSWPGAGVVRNTDPSALVLQEGLVAPVRV
jgi:hypothetical protein